MKAIKLFMLVASVGAVSLARAQGVTDVGTEWRLPSNAAIQAAPKPVLPKVDLIESGPGGQKARIDLESLAKQYQALQRPQQGGQSQDARPQGLLAFVSFSMPEESLKGIIRQAQACGGVIIIRGFYERSMTKTAKKIQDLMGENKVAWMIDPKSFSSYQVTTVPTYVLTSPRGGQDVGFSKQAGDVTLDNFLESVQLQDKPLAPTAQAYLRRIRG